MRRKDLVVGAHYAAGPRTTYDRWRKARVEVLSTEKRNRQVSGAWHGYTTDDGVDVRVIEPAVSHIVHGDAGAVVIVPLRNILEPWEVFVEKRDPALTLVEEQKEEGKARDKRLRSVVDDLTVQGIEVGLGKAGIYMTLEQAERLLERIVEMKLDL